LSQNNVAKVVIAKVSPANETIWQSGGAGREALREELGWEYLAQQNCLYHPDKNALFTLRHSNPYISPAETTYWDDVNKAFEGWTANEPYLVYVNGLTALYSKRQFKYGAFGFRAQIPSTEDPAFNSLFLGAETSGGTHGGIGAFWFRRIEGTNKTYIQGISNNKAGARTSEVTDLLSIDPSADFYRYLVKVNKSSIEFWVENQIVGIIQFAPNSDTYHVRTSAPYYLGQVKGQTPCFMPALIEYKCSDAEYIGSRSNIQLGNIYVTDGDSSPPRTLHLYTSGSPWEGTTGVDPDITSDGIPIAGYDKKQIFFLATGDGDLEIYVDYGDNNYDLYDTVSVTADTLLSYLTEAEALWLKLKYIPTTPPQNITRARVLMR